MSEKIYTTGENIEKREEKEVVFEEVAELELPIKKIIEKIKSRIDAGEYSLIIGDDASGRIPTRILGGFIQKICETRNLPSPNIIFIPGKLETESGRSFLRRIFGHRNTSRVTQQQELDNYIAKWGGTKERKILIVTDSLISGLSLKNLIELLKKEGYGCDLVTIAIEPPLIGQGIKENLRGMDIFSGEYRVKDRSAQDVPLLYRPQSKKLSGVYKNPGDKVSKTLKSSALPEGINPEDVNPESVSTDNSRQEIQESVNQSRIDANIVLEHLINWYESQKQDE